LVYHPGIIIIGGCPDALISDLMTRAELNELPALPSSTPVPMERIPGDK
jgi:hypothetical protein